MDNLREVLNFLRNYGPPIALGITWVTIVLVWYGRRARWLRKEFMSQVNFSLNYISNNSLMMRTLLETTTDKVIMNEWGVKTLACTGGTDNRKGSFHSP